MPETFHFEQPEHHPVLRVDAREGVPDGHLQRHILRYRGRVGGQRRLGLALALAACVVTAIQQDAINPGRQARIELERARGPVYLQERFLYGIFGIGAVAQPAEGEAYQSVLDSVYQSLELGGCLRPSR